MSLVPYKNTKKGAYAFGQSLPKCIHCTTVGCMCAKVMGSERDCQIEIAFKRKPRP